MRRVQVGLKVASVKLIFGQLMMPFRIYSFSLASLQLVMMLIILHFMTCLRSLWLLLLIASLCRFLICENWMLDQAACSEFVRWSKYRGFKRAFFQLILKLALSKVIWNDFIITRLAPIIYLVELEAIWQINILLRDVLIILWSRICLKI